MSQDGKKIGCLRSGSGSADFSEDSGVSGQCLWWISWSTMVTLVVTLLLSLTIIFQPWNSKLWLLHSYYLSTMQFTQGAKVLFMQIKTFSTYKTKPNLQGKAKKTGSITSKLLLFSIFFFGFTLILSSRNSNWHPIAFFTYYFCKGFKGMIIWRLKFPLFLRLLFQIRAKIWLQT